MGKLISVVVPVHNEAGNIRALYDAVCGVFEKLPYSFELLFVDDGSTDESLSLMSELGDTDERVGVVALSRNFGKEAALSAGIDAAKGDAVVLMDADLQHPPEVIPELVKGWEGGADVTIGVRRTNPDEGLVRKLGSRAFAGAMRMSDIPMVRGATDFRIIDRSVADEFRRFTERGRITRGLIDWLGFSRAFVEFDAAPRHAGSARYGFRKLASLGVNAFLSHSLVPLRLAGYFGVAITIVSGALGLFIIVEQVILGDPLRMDATPIGMMAIMILFLNGIVLVGLGLVSLYIEKIHREIINRPLYVLRKRTRA